MNLFIGASVFVTLLMICSVEAQSNTGDGYIYRLSVTQDVWLEDGGNKNGYPFIIVGKHRSYPLKRSLLQFQNLPRACRHIKWAKMYLYFIYSHKPSSMSVTQAPYISRPLQMHQVKQRWSETQATNTRRLYSYSWRQPWLALDGTDADPNGLLCESVTINTYRPAGFVEFDITEAMRNWQNGDPNYGVLLMATNENTYGRDIRFGSKSNSNSNQRPYVNVLCS